VVQVQTGSCNCSTIHGDGGNHNSVLVDLNYALGISTKVLGTFRGF